MCPQQLHPHQENELMRWSSLFSSEVILIWGHVTRAVTPGQGLPSILVWLLRTTLLATFGLVAHRLSRSCCVTSRAHITVSAGRFPALGSVQMTDSVSEQAAFLFAHIRLRLTTPSWFSLSFRRRKVDIIPSVPQHLVCVLFHNSTVDDVTLDADVTEEASVSYGTSFFFAFSMFPHTLPVFSAANV